MNHYKRCSKSGLNETNAWHIAHKMQKDGDEVHAYHCRDCGLYHVGFSRLNITNRRRKYQ